MRSVILNQWRKRRTGVIWQDLEALITARMGESSRFAGGGLLES